MATTDDYVRLGFVDFIRLCEHEWQTPNAHAFTVPDNPIARQLETERRAIERRHRRRTRKDRRTWKRTTSDR